MFLELKKALHDTLMRAALHGLLLTTAKLANLIARLVAIVVKIKVCHDVQPQLMNDKSNDLIKSHLVTDDINPS